MKRAGMLVLVMVAFFTPAEALRYYNEKGECVFVVEEVPTGLDREAEAIEQYIVRNAHGNDWGNGYEAEIHDVEVQVMWDKRRESDGGQGVDYQVALECWELFSASAETEVIAIMALAVGESAIRTGFLFPSRKVTIAYSLVGDWRWIVLPVDACKDAVRALRDDRRRSSGSVIEELLSHVGSPSQTQPEIYEVFSH